MTPPLLRASGLTAAYGKMSGGEQQMVAIGRALMTTPKLVLLDEPSLGPGAHPDWRPVTPAKDPE